MGGLAMLLRGIVEEIVLQQELIKLIQTTFIFLRPGAELRGFHWNVRELVAFCIRTGGRRWAAPCLSICVLSPLRRSAAHTTTVHAIDDVVAGLLCYRVRRDPCLHCRVRWIFGRVSLCCTRCCTLIIRICFHVIAKSVLFVHLGNRLKLISNY